ncbi:MAG: hypothetical protein HWD86_11240 [Kangiellaceae bacterium]|nr:hypothetical protein [Kangiellaceae bacterium]
MTKPEDDTPSVGKAPEEQSSSIEDRKLARQKPAETGTSGHMTAAEFKAFMDEMWGEEADQGGPDMVDLTIHDIPDKVLLLLERMAAKRGMTAEDLAREMICNAFVASKPPRFVEITEEQFRQNSDALIAAYDQDPIVIVDEKGRRFVLMPAGMFELITEK